MPKYNWNGFEVCEYPNIAAEAYYHNGGHPDTFASFANVTRELFGAFLMGYESLTMKEVAGTQRLLNSLTRLSHPLEYLCSSHINVVCLDDPENMAAMRLIYESLDRAGRSLRYGCSYLIPWEQLQKMETIPLAYVHYAIRLLESAEQQKSIEAKEKSRRGRSFTNIVA